MFWSIRNFLCLVSKKVSCFVTSNQIAVIISTSGTAWRCDVPNVVAAVDAVVLEMRAPTSTRLRDKKQTNISSQYCRKGFFATTMLAFVDANIKPIFNPTNQDSWPPSHPPLLRVHRQPWILGSSAGGLRIGLFRKWKQWADWSRCEGIPETCPFGQCAT